MLEDINPMAACVRYRSVSLLAYPTVMYVSSDTGLVYGNQLVFCGS